MKTRAHLIHFTGNELPFDTVTVLFGVTNQHAVPQTGRKLTALLFEVAVLQTVAKQEEKIILP